MSPGLWNVIKISWELEKWKYFSWQNASETLIFCTFQKKQRRSYKKHANFNADGIYVCSEPTCYREFTSPLLLAGHQYETDHFNVTCDTCGVTFVTKRNLRRHLKSLHLQEEYVCTQCPQRKVFNRKDRRIYHELTIHGVVKCDVCYEGFTDKKLLREHVLTHQKK